MEDSATSLRGCHPLGKYLITESMFARRLLMHLSSFLQPGMERFAAFLEPRRVAAIKGASVEFEKMEGITYDYDRNKVS
jgi:hypothetical protein